MAANTLVSALQESPILATCILAASIVLFCQLFVPPAALTRPGSKQREVRSWPFASLGATRFYSDRMGFLFTHMGPPSSLDKEKGSKLGRMGVRANLCQHIVIVSGGTRDAKTFFSSPSLAFGEAYKVLFAGVPQVPSWVVFLKGLLQRDTSNGEGQAKLELLDSEARIFFLTNLRNATSQTRLEVLVGEMAKYCIESFGRLAPQSGVIDTHDTIYNLIFRISIRTVGCQEHTDEANIQKLVVPFFSFQSNTGFFATHFPLLPFPSTVRKWASAAQLHQELLTTITARGRENRTEEDYVQVMLDQGISANEVALFITRTLFAAIINSTGMSAYLLLFAGTMPTVMARLREEIEAVAREEAVARKEDYDQLSIRERASGVSLQAWETKMPFLDACLKETMRILLLSTMFRKYSPKGGRGEDLQFGGEALQKGDFLAFWLASTHMNEDIYTSPSDWDPDRFFLRKEGLGENEFLGWGSGRYPCAGMRFAKLEIKVVTACFVLSFDCATVDLQGKPYTQSTMPRPELNDEHKRTPSKPVRLAYSVNRAAAEL